MNVESPRLGQVAFQIAADFRAAGARGWLHARRLDRTNEEQEIAVSADVQVPMASLYKVPLAVAWARAVDAGLDPTQPVDVPATERTPGPTGLSAFHDSVRISQRDLVVSMLTASDNAAADVLLAQVGLPAVRQVLADAGATATTVHGGTRLQQRQLLEDVGAPGFPEALRVLASRPHQAPTAIYDPALSSSTTARDMTLLLQCLWCDELASPESSRFVRQTMARQIFRHRLASGLPHDDVEIAGKTGTLVALRHEIAVVTFPAEAPVAVAVLTQALNPAQHLPDIEHVIGQAAGRAVQALRQPVYP